MKLSIITINYNNTKGLLETINSIENQSFKLFEFIVIDGKSTDGSIDIIKENESIITYWESEKDNGVYHAMNKGIRKAKGEFVIFMNSGDTFYENDTLEKIIPHLDSEFGIYYGDIKKKKGNKLSTKTYPDKLNFSYFYTGALCHQSSFIKRELFHQYFFYNEDYKISSDWEFFLYTICKENVKYKHLDIIICVYDFSGISSVNEYADYHTNERIETFKKYFPAFVEDYKVLSKLNEKRTKQFFYIQKFSIPFKTLKGIMSIILVFLPKIKFK